MAQVTEYPNAPLADVERFEEVDSEGQVKGQDNGLQALEGEERLRLFHLKAILVSGIGFFTDAYDLQVIASVKPMMAMARWPGKVPAAYQGDLNQHGVGSLPTLVDLEFSAIALIGTLFSPVSLSFEVSDKGCLRQDSSSLVLWVIRWVERVRTPSHSFCTELAERKEKQTLPLLVGMTILQVVAAWGNEGTFVGLFLTWRFLLGVGIGGNELSACFGQRSSQLAFKSHSWGLWYLLLNPAQANGNPFMEIGIHKFQT